MYERPSSLIFRDISTLSFDYVPDELPHRENEMHQMFRLFSPVVSGGSQNVLLTGSVGTGKTVLAKRFCVDFKSYCAKNGRNIDYAIINCRFRNTTNSVLLRILNLYQPHFPDRGFSTAEMHEVLRKELDKRKSNLLVVLDEADVLVKKSGSDIIYLFSRFGEESIGKGRNISIILISQMNVLDLLEPAALSTFKRTNIIRFGKYSENALYDILKQRAELALFPGGIEDETVHLISEIAAEYGDARYAIEILERSGQLTDDRRGEFVTPEDVRSATATIKPTVTESKLVQLDRQRKLVLLAVARSIKNRAYTTTGEVERTYHIACEEYGEEKRGHTQFWKYIKELDALGLISAKKSTVEEGPGATTAISLQDVPSTVLKEKLIELLTG